MPSPPDDPGPRELVLETVKKFAKRHLPPSTLLSLDKGQMSAEPLLRSLLSPQVGLHLIFVPQLYGGLGLGALDLCHVTRELARADLALATSFFAIALGLDPILVGGSESQRERWLSRFAEEGLVFAYGVTEQQAGSEVAAIRTRADPVLQQERLVGYRLNGTKQFITNSGIADVYTILAMAPKGPSFFLVPRDTPGLSFGPPEDKHGIRSSRTGQVILEEVTVPPDCLVGEEEGLGLPQATQVFAFTRLMVAALALGAGRAALQGALAHARQRVQFGTPLSHKQGYTHKLLVPQAARLEAAQAYIEQICRRLDAGEKELQTEGAIAKLFTTEVANRAADDAIQALGGYGYMREYHVERIKRDLRVTTIYEGTSEILQRIIGLDRWRACRQSRFMAYEDLARELDALSGGDGGGAARIVALAARALNSILPLLLEGRLTRQQHVLFELAEMAVRVEVAAALAREAHADTGPSQKVRCALARLYAGEAAAQVFDRAVRLVAGTGAARGEVLRELDKRLDRHAFHASIAGAVADMDVVAAHLNEDRSQ